MNIFNDQFGGEFHFLKNIKESEIKKFLQFPLPNGIDVFIN